MTQLLLLSIAMKTDIYLSEKGLLFNKNKLISGDYFTSVLLSGCYC